MRILVTGGAGFVGSHLARAYRAQNLEVVVLDNLKRRGAELNLAAFKAQGISFHHGDIRCPSDLEDLPGNFDFLIEASAEPSVLAGLNGSPQYVLGTNLTGTLNCLEFARKRCGATAFLSTSRVYSIAELKAIKLREESSRFEIEEKQTLAGVSTKGVAENFCTSSARSLYGASKLASEMIVQEYAFTYGLKAVINRCGVIAGPGQFGKVDQGVFTLWVANHHFKKPLKYTGFGGKGKQVRDLLHPSDLFALLQKQLAKPSGLTGEVYNVGGGREISVSMQEMTTLCQDATGNKVSIASDETTASVDIPLYVTDNSKVEKAFGWRAQKDPKMITTEIAAWIRNNEKELAPLFG